MCKSGEGVNSGPENGGWPLSQGGGAEEKWAGSGSEEHEGLQFHLQALGHEIHYIGIQMTVNCHHSKLEKTLGTGGEREVEFFGVFAAAAHHEFQGTP